MSESIQKKQPPRQTEAITTEVRNKEKDPNKPAIIEHPDSEVQMTSKRTMEDQHPALAEQPPRQK